MARARLTEMGAEATLTAAELRSLGDAYYNAGRYGEAAEQYRALAADMPRLSADERNSFAVAAAACDLKLKRLTMAQAQALPDTNDENGARRLYLLMELARDRDDLDEQQRIVAEMESQVSRRVRGWPRRFTPAATCTCCGAIMRRRWSTTAPGRAFPDSKNAATAHWRAGWLSYRQGLYADAARLFDEQIRLYPAAAETAAALYWRGRLYETEDHNPAQAAANYRAIVRAYQHYFYAQMARERLAALGNTQPAPAPQLDRLQPMTPPLLVESFPSESPHLARGAAAGQRGIERIYCARDQGRPDVGVVERIGGGADLCVVWGDVSRHAGDEAGLAV